jgi:hypothetical protein
MIRQLLAASVVCACLIGPTATRAQETPDNTATGTVISVLGPAGVEETLGATSTVCAYWQITLASKSGQRTVVHVKSPASGSVATGFTPTDQAALRTVKTFEQAYADGSRATVTVLRRLPNRL